MILSKRGAVVFALLAAAVLGSSLLFSSVAGPYQVRITSNREQPSAEPSRRAITDRVFLLLKSGVEVMYDRMPAHIATTLKRFPTHVAYADVNYTVSGLQTVDCLSFLDDEMLNSDHLRAYRLRRQSDAQHWNWGSKDILIENDKSGWQLDRFKNMPAFAHAWLQDPTKDWYVMIDADSYMFAHTLEFITAKHDPNDLIYLGKAVGGEPFAHGGSGIVLSRGAMLAIFGTTHEQMWDRLLEAGRRAAGSCCGDEIVAQMFTSVTGLPSGDLLDHTELGQFQGGQIPTVFIPTNEQWCNAAPTFHELKGWEIYRLDKWEADCDAAGVNPTYAQYYHDFVKQQVVPELPNWVFHTGNYDGADVAIDVRKYDVNTPEAHDKHQCIRKCAEAADCMMWTYLGDELCKNFHNAVSTGSKMNEHNPMWNNWPEVASGYMVDRVKTFRESQPCDITARSRGENKGHEDHNEDHDEEKHEEEHEEGWFIRQLKDEFQMDGAYLTSEKITASH